MFNHAHCTICKRPLSQEADPLSMDCGGDCLECMLECEDGEGAPDLPPDRLRLWLDMHADVEHRLVEAGPAYHYDPVRQRVADRAPLKVEVLDAWPNMVTRMTRLGC